MISEGQFMLTTAIPDVYTKFVDDEKLFSRRHHLFAFGLIYGLLHNIRYDKKPISDIVAVNRISKSEVTKDIIDIVYDLLDDGKSTESATWNEMLHIADGGVLELKKIFEKNKSFTIHSLITDSANLWPQRAKELHNINLQQMTK